MVILSKFVSDSSASSRLYEFGYSQDDSSTHQYQNKHSAAYVYPSQQLQEKEMLTKPVVKTSPRNFNDKTKNTRSSGSNSLTRKHLEMKRNASKDNIR